MSEKNNTGVVHFSIGDMFGVMITNLAIEHMYYSMNPEKAEKLLTDSLVGLSRDLAIEILKGKLLVTVDTNEQTCGLMSSYDCEDDSYIRIDPLSWASEKYRLVEQHAMDLWECMDAYYKDYNKGKSLISVNIKNMISTYEGNYEFITDLLDDDNLYVSLKSILDSVQVYMNETTRVQVVTNYMRINFGKDFQDFPDDLPEIHHLLVRRYNKLMRDGTFRPDSKDAIDAEEIIAVRDAAIIATPVDIMDKYDAGWISPEGDVYALSGNISEMLHNTIAEALLLTGKISIDDSDSISKRNPYWYLESHGWVKFHGRWVLFSSGFDGEGLRVTDKQVKKLCMFGNLHCRGSLDFGYRRETMSCAKFAMIAENNPFYLDKLFSL